MKKVLFLTTALIATGSMAAADVRISGYGRFGLDYNEDNGAEVGDPGAPGAVNTDEVNLTSRLRLQFDMSTETDGGITFGARYRAQAESRDNAPGGATFNGGRFFMSWNGFTFAAGNILGAIENTQGLYLETRTAGIGIDGAGFASVVTNMGTNSFDWDAYSSAGAGVNGVEVLYDSANWGGHISYSKARDVAATAGGTITALTDGEENSAISAYYRFGDWTVALGYNNESGGATGGVNVDNDILLFTVQGDLGFMGVRLAYAEMDNLTTATSAGGTVTNDASKLGLYGTFDIGAASSLVVYVTDEDNSGAITDGTGYGIHYSYDLGGGVSFEAGYRENSADNQTFQAGVYFSF